MPKFMDLFENEPEKNDSQTKKLPEVKVKKSKKKQVKKSKKSSFNPSLELNLIKAMYANRFGSSTNKRKDDMVEAIMEAWSE